MIKKITLIIISVLCLGLAGCILEEVPLSDTEYDVIAQFAADRLMAHDNNNEKWTVDPRLLTPTPTNTPTPTATDTPTPTSKPATPTPDPNATPIPTNTPTPTVTPTPFPSNTTETWKQLAKVIGAEEFEVRFMGASEPEKSFSIGDSYYALSKVPGYEHLAVKIQIWNRTGETKYLNVNAMQIECVLMINGDLPRRQETTMFMNELRYIGIQGGEKGEAVAPYEKYKGEQGAIIVFLVPEGIDIERAGLGITNKNGDEVIIKIQ